MEITGIYKIHRLETLLPKKIPKKIDNIEKLFDKYGLKKSAIEFPANSLVRAFVPSVLCFANANIANVPDTTNTLRTVSPGSFITIALSQSGGNETAFGIVLGSGTTAVTINDYALETLIAHGTGAGQLNYNLMSGDFFFPVQIVGSSSYWSALRPISNFTNNDIDVKEAGVYLRNNTFNFCIERTVLSSTYTFVSKSSVVVEYIVKVTV